jgi:hypothetical protein
MDVKHTGDRHRLMPSKPKSPRKSARSKPKKAAPRSAAQVEKELAGFIAKFEPATAKLIRQCREEVRKLFPTAIQLVYDNYNFFVIGYSSTERPSDCIVSIAAAANGVGLSLYYGSRLKDPAGLLEGAGSQNRFIRLPNVDRLRVPAVRALIRAAEAQGKVRLPKTGGGHTIIRSISAKQRPRRHTTTKG